MKQIQVGEQKHTLKQNTPDLRNFQQLQRNEQLGRKVVKSTGRKWLGKAKNWK